MFKVLSALMTTLVVQSHPLEDSYNAALLDAVLSRAALRGAEPTVVRLCQGDPLSTEFLVDATELVVVYPTWWGSLPAVLLAALNDVIGPWVDGTAIESSPLRSVQHINVVTSHGSSRFINRLQGEPGLHLWKRTVLPLCAPKATFEWTSLYKLDRLDQAARAEFVEAVGQPRHVRSARAS